MDRPIFNKVKETLYTHPRIKNVQVRKLEGKETKEINKRLAPYHVGGCFKKRYQIEPANDERLQKFVMDIEDIIQEQHYNLLTANDKPLRLISSCTEGYGDEEKAYIDVYTIPDPE